MNRFLTVKTNALKRFPDASYTLTCAADGNALCNACAASTTCPSVNTRQRCSEFVPVLQFAINDNLTLPLYNTIRIGKAWSDRLPVGARVGVWDGVKRELTYAKVKASFWGEDKQQVLDHHAANNHIGMTLEFPRRQMAEVLQRCYGKGFYARSYGLSAIYLSPF